MHGLHTTAWVFDTTDYKAIKVIDQYRDADHALAGALRIIKAIMEEVASEYTLTLLNDDVVVGGELIRGICVTVEDAPIGTFVPQAELESPFQLVVDGEEQFYLY